MHDAVHHVGDLQSLKADANGVARFDFVASKLTLRDGPANGSSSFRVELAKCGALV
ncbi:MAG: hypothetical protein Fur007_22970 [Rhodoferax sp.]